MRRRRGILQDLLAGDATFNEQWHLVGLAFASRSCPLSSAISNLLVFSDQARRGRGEEGTREEKGKRKGREKRERRIKNREMYRK